MNQAIRKTAAVMLALLLCSPAGCFVPETGTVYAAVAVSGDCGEQLQWSFDDGTLTLTGSGVMQSWSYYTQVPWYPHHAQIKQVVLPDGLTSIGSNAFNGCAALDEAVIPDSVTQIGRLAFQACSALTAVTVRNPNCRIADQETTIPQKAAIYSYEGSLAAYYAKKYSREFVKLDGEPAVQYTYEIIPMLEPFNEYFYVKTENPDPYSFRFVDPASAYGEEASVRMHDKSYADVQYENEETMRVRGGYIFYSGNTDGGELSLQLDNQTNPPKEVEVLNLSTGETTIRLDRSPIWVDTGITCTLPELYDETDYLIKSYATDSEFFANMDLVQSGLKKICLYSGSYIRGEVYRKGKEWFVSNSPHVDQTFYIQSPYTRKDNVSLLMTALYPYRYDSLGFPGMMGSVAKRMDSSATYTRSSTNHYTIEVEYNGEKKSYGGQGSGKGQGIDHDQILEYFDFADGAPAYQLGDIRERLGRYAGLTVESDVPQTDNLTWDSIYDTVGNGAWISMAGIASVFGGTYGCYGYLWQKDDKKSFHADESGVGGSIYWSGSLGYASDTWVDGRYIDKYERYVPGETFDKHPESSIILRDISIPSLKYSGSKQKGYSNIKITETVGSVRYVYNKEANLWKADSSTITPTTLNVLTDMTVQGLVDPKYLDVLELTPEEVAELQIDRNTNIAPVSYYIYNGSAAPGTAVSAGDLDGDGTVSVADAVILQKWLLGVKGTDMEKPHNADMNGNGIVDIFDLGLLKRKLL